MIFEIGVYQVLLELQSFCKIVPGYSLQEEQSF